MSALVSQLQAGLRRHDAKPPRPLPPVVYEDARITIHRDGCRLIQMNKPRPGQTIAVLYVRK